MSNIRDGGVSALAGYLYQIVGVLGMKAWAHCSDVSSDSEELDALLTLTRTAELHHERFDQDAVIWPLGVESDDECVFAQFKFSRQTPPPTIGREELIDIVNGLGKSAQRASELGCNVTGYALVTNRRLGDQAEELRQAARKGVSHPRLKNNEQLTILSQLRIITELHLSEWDVALRRFGRKFGAIEQEVEDGINKLIGYVFSQTVKQNGVLVTEANLIEAFTGCQDARPLIPESVVEHSARSINDFPINLPMAPVRRQLLNEITEATSKRALVVLHGLGGCGKTVALCQWAQELTAVSPPGAGAFTTIGLASDAVRFWIAEVICEWGNIFQNPSRRSEQPEHALERLRLANPDLALPIIHLGLDGLDEDIGNADQVNIVKEILRWFWEEDKRLQQELRPPKATLVLTCRDARDLEQKWLRLDVSGYGYRGEPPHSLEVCDFSLEELLLAAKEAASQTDLPELYHRIRATVRAANGDQLRTLMEGYEPSPFGTSNPFVIAADEEVLEALKHPAMWRALLELESDIQLQVLDGEPRATKKLADVLVHRFCRKVIDRGRLVRLREDGMICVLHAIALHCQTNGQVQQSPIADWVDPACNTKLVGGNDANVLYSEALWGGVITEDDPKHWRWRHKLVWDYLAVLESI